LLDKTIILESDKFDHQIKYIIKFNKDNFLHLTGVISKLSAKDFFDKCYDTPLVEDDFDYNSVKNKANIKNKLRFLITNKFLKVAFSHTSGGLKSTSIYARFNLLSI